MTRIVRTWAPTLPAALRWLTPAVGFRRRRAGASWTRRCRRGCARSRSAAIARAGRRGRRARPRCPGRRDGLQASTLAVTAWSLATVGSASSTALRPGRSPRDTRSWSSDMSWSISTRASWTRIALVGWRVCIGTVSHQGSGVGVRTGIDRDGRIHERSRAAQAPVLPLWARATTNTASQAATARNPRTMPAVARPEPTWLPCERLI